MVDHQAVGLAPGIDLHLIAQGQIALDVELGGGAGIEDQIIVVAKLQPVDPVAAATEIESDLGRALVSERLEVAGLQIAVDGGIADHLQRLMELDGQIAAITRRRDLALPPHL
ncbi:hypothetical protein D3C78_647470 [compost metagenome]